MAVRAARQARARERATRKMGTGMMAAQKMKTWEVQTQKRAAREMETQGRAARQAGPAWERAVGELAMEPPTARGRSPSIAPGARCARAALAPSRRPAG